jgi:hypothetical protein
MQELVNLSLYDDWMSDELGLKVEGGGERGGGGKLRDYPRTGKSESR